jgi:FlaA1/EpsC-like NDP-sugar epimerase
VTVTHPDVTRFFMTIREASQLVVLQVGAARRTAARCSSSTWASRSGSPTSRGRMIHLSGFTEAQIPIRVVGTRPGEKLFEELSTTAENLAPTDVRKIFRCRPVPLDPARLNQLLERLAFLVKAKDGEGVRQVLRDLDIGYEITPARQA